MANVYDFPMRKEYNLNLSIEVVSGEKVESIVKKISYKQATIIETIEEFNEMDKIGLENYLTKYLKENGQMSDNEIILLGMNKEKLEELSMVFLTTRFCGVIDKESILNKKRELLSQGGVPYRGILVILSQKLHIDPLAFQEKYTFEQMTYLLGGIEYRVNKKTPEGEAINRQKYESNVNYDNMLIQRLSKV